MRERMFLMIVISTGMMGCSAQEKAPWEQATEHFKMGEWEAAIKICDQLIAEDAKNSDVWLLRGRCYLGKQMLEIAVRDYAEAIRLQPEDPEAYYHRAIAYKMLEKPDLAGADRDVARSLDMEARRADAMRYSTGNDQYDVVVRSDHESSNQRDPSGKDESESLAHSDDFSVGLDDSIDAISPYDLAGLEFDSHEVIPAQTVNKPDTGTTRVTKPEIGRDKLDVSRASDRFKRKQMFRLDSDFDSDFRRGWLRDHRSIEGGDELASSKRGVPLSPDGRGSTHEHEKTEESDGQIEQTEPSEAPIRPRSPNGTFFLHDNTATAVPHTGYPYSSGPERREPSGSYEKPLYSLPGTGLRASVSGMSSLAPMSPRARQFGPSSQPFRSGGGQRPIAGRGRPAFGFGQPPRVGMGLPIERPGQPVRRPDNWPRGTASVSPPPVPPNTGGSASPSSNWQYIVPFPPGDLPTTGIVPD